MPEAGASANLEGAIKPMAPPDSSGSAPQPPRPLERMRPAYPALAREHGEEGTVLLGVRIGTDGRVREVRLLRSSGSLVLDAAASRAAEQWRFQPAQSEGRPVEAWLNVPVPFRLEGAGS